MHLIYFPKFLHNSALSSIFLGTPVIPGRNWKQWLCKIWMGLYYRPSEQENNVMLYALFVSNNSVLLLTDHVT